MKTIMGIVLLLILFGLGGPVSLLGEDLELFQPPAKLYLAAPDLLLVRPVLGMGALAPSAAFLATLPFSYPLKKDLKVAEYLLHQPWTYTADRPLGVFVPGKSITKRLDQTISSQYQNYFVQVGVDRSPDER